MSWTNGTLTLDVVSDLGGNTDLMELRLAIEVVVTPSIEYAIADAATATFKFTADPDQSEKDAVVAVAATHRAGALGRAQLKRAEEFDSRTEKLITESGFSHNGRVFSSSSNAQSKWHAVQIMNLMGQIGFPLLLSDKDEHSYAVADSAELSLMYATLVGTGKASHDSGKALKDQLDAITNDAGQPDVPPNYHDLAAAIAAVEAVVDPR